MASNPPDSCCVRGFKHEGTASGHIGHIGDAIETYFAYPPGRSTTSGILLLTDVLGHSSINAQLMADHFAENGFFVMMPDLFDGDRLILNAPDFNLPAFLQRHDIEKTDPVIKEALKTMKDTYGCHKIAGVGYCFGAKYVVRFLKPGQIDVGYVAHPSYVEEDELLAIEGPFAISAAETDHIFPIEKRHRSEELLSESGQPWQLCIFSGVEHGFAVRGNMLNRLERMAKEQASVQAVNWLKQWLV